MLKPASRTTLHEDVLRQVVEAIKESHWAPGSRLPGEKALAETFGVSRACIREVLKALAFSGVLESRPGQGTFLSPNAERILKGSEAAAIYADSSYKDLLEIRRLLEGQAAYWAAERATSEDFDRLEHILMGEERGESLEFIHDKFHHALAHISGNRLLVKLLESMRNEISAQRSFHNKVLPDEDRLEHWEILRLLRSGSSRKAWDAMRRHVDFFWRKV